MFDVNEYFEGKVKSIAFQTATLPATIGVMAEGEYEFATRQKEYMTVTSGALEALLPGCDTWQRFSQGESFEVPADSRFGVRVKEQTSYLCLYE